ncbi:molecular chaperone DnaJ [Candidatus Falkowbacteria bacterium]|nr:molecular chaperone DnaJ [Candidatus Falkowbacteria bacterium]
MSKDYYNVLGVSKGASSDEIKTAFRKKAHEHHPDKGGDEEKFKEINEAYQVLGNETKRKQYDQFGTTFNNNGGGFSGGQNWGGFSGFQNGANFDFDDISDMFGGFGDIFGFGRSHSRSRRETAGRDIEILVKLDFLEAVFGGEKEISFSKKSKCDKCDGSGAEPGAKVETCSSCHGSGFVVKLQRTILGNIQTKQACSQCGGEGKTYSENCSKCGGSGVYKKQEDLKVKIPAGINSGESIRLSGKGEAGEKGAPAGDLFLRIQVLPHKKFQRDDYDIKTEEEISVTQAILGDKIEIDTVEGKVKLKIPEGTQSGTIFKLKEKGVSRLRANGKGDHYVRVKVKIPKNLTKKQKNTLVELGL